MQSGMINKVAIISAEVIDSKGMKHVIPDQGAVYADKGYCDINAKKAAAKRNLHLAAVKKNNMIGKNKDLDKFYTKLRSPYERVFFLKLIIESDIKELLKINLMPLWKV